MIRISRSTARRSVLAAGSGIAIAAIVMAATWSPRKSTTSAVTASQSPARNAFPAHYLAPYIDTSVAPDSVLTMAKTPKHYTLGFITNAKAHRCQAAWNQTHSITNTFWGPAINKLRTSGGDVIVSFGGGLHEGSAARSRFPTGT